MSKPLVIKYGGNAMVNEEIQAKILEIICRIKQEGQNVVIVHGGGPFIKESLQKENIESSFVDGQRVTSAEALSYVERVLKGQVNSLLVEIINKNGQKAVGLSGKDGKIAIASKRFANAGTEDNPEPVDLGFVGDIDHINTDLLELLLTNDYFPVITCLAPDQNGDTYNINADVFAGHIAGALRAKEFLLLTDVDGLLADINDKSSLISNISVNEIPDLIQRKIIKGGMIPKLEACITALKQGAEQVRILNGTNPDQLLAFMRNEPVGTVVSV
jgi:acetylglutamate kinase